MLEGTNALNISVDDIEAFHRDGAVLIKNVLSKDWLDLLERGIEYIQHHPDGMSAGVGMPLRIDQFPASHSADLDQVMKASPISEIVGRVLERPVRFYMDQMFYKPAGEMFPSAWHQDTSYYNIEGDQVVRAWVCVDPVPRDASIEVVRGSHRWNITYRPPVGMDPKTDPEGAAALEAAYAAGDILIGREAHASWTYFDSFLDPALPQLPDIESSRDSFDILGWDFAPGDVLLFHGNILHSARGGAVLDHPRRAHASLWIGPDVHYLRRRSQAIPDPIQLYDYHPLDGQPLADFDEVFPIAWAPA
ncbi:MAG: phytanoyl-CoA dioxygenase family protein [Pseudomonadales bacterium]|jgi:ectoine hydroxylase-related dioxygenase (phytanoyl-CoA dioxygenase family)